MATIGELLVQLGINQDKASFKKAENSVKKFGKDARKILAKVGIVLSTAKLISILKNTENIKNAITEVKENWTKVFTELDNSLGVTKTIAVWIKKGSNLLLSLFRKVEPFIKNAVKRLGGTENTLKSILSILGAIKAAKAFATAFNIKSKSTIGILVTVLYALYLIIEDIVFFVQGKGSFLGHLCKKYGVDVDKLRAKLKSIITKAKSFIPKAFTFIKDTLGKVFQKIATAAEKAFVIIKNFWENHGQKIARNLKDAWDKLADTFQKLKEKLKPIADKISEVVSEFNKGENSIDVWDLIGTALEKVSDFLVIVADKIGAVVDYLPDLEEIQSFVDEHRGALEVLATIIGSVAAAILIVKGAIAAYTAVTTVAAIVSGAFSAAVAAINWPFIIAVAIIAAVIAIVVLLVKHWDKIKEKAQELASTIKQKFEEIKNTIKQKVDGIKEKFTNAFNKIKSFIKEWGVVILAFLLNPLAGIVALVVKYREQIAKKISELKDKIKNIIGKIKEAIRSAIDKVKDFVKQHIVLIIGIITGPIGALIATIVKHRDQIAQKIAELKEKIQTIISNIKEAVSTKIAEIKETISTKWEEIKKFFTDLPAKALQWGKDLIQGFIDGIVAKWEALKEKVSGLASMVTGFLGHSTPDEGPMKGDDKWMPDFMENLIGGIDKKLPALKDRIKGIASSFDLEGGLNMVLSKTQNLVAGASATNVINMNNNWTNNFNGDQGKAFASAVTSQEEQVGTTLGRRLANTR